MWKFTREKVSEGGTTDGYLQISHVRVRCCTARLSDLKDLKDLKIVTVTQ